jgi:hypothetical protein
MNTGTGIGSAQKYVKGGRRLLGLQRAATRAVHEIPPGGDHERRAHRRDEHRRPSVNAQRVSR